MSARGPVAAIAAAALVAAGIPAALGDDGRVREVSIPGKVFAPGVLQVLAGETVVWRNGDVTNHTVTADDGTFDSGFLSSGTTFSLTFSKLGHYAYHCTIHKFMHGEIVVVPIALHGPGRPVVSGNRVVLQGLAPAGARKVTVASLGGRRHSTRHTAPAGDGSFTVAFRAVRPVSYAARVGRLSSTPVRIAVAPHVEGRLHGGVLSATARPARPGAPAVLQRYVRERFAWRTVSHGRLDSSSRVSFELPSGRVGRFRIVVRGGHGWADGTSDNVVRHG